MYPIRIKRVYDEALPTDGKRVLVDRIWPRGLSKEAAAVDVWMKELAPSHELRKRFAHDPERFESFRADYRTELQQNAAAAELLRDLLAWAEASPVTLVYAAKDEAHNQAVVLQEWLKNPGN